VHFHFYMYPIRVSITLDKKKFKKFVVFVMNMLLIYLFASMKLEKGHKN